MSSVDTLIEMLAFRRPAFSVHEEAFIEKYIEPLGCSRDHFGNLYLDIGKNPTTLWSSHTDTVHTKGGFQELIVQHGNVRVHKSSHRDSNCLGAHCTTGVWLMSEMIKGGVPGRYVFHRDEESGGRGAKYIQKYNRPVLDGIKHAIAFDRKGTNEVITHQGYSRTASDDFAESLCSALKLGYKKSDRGMFTDTKVYQYDIPECTNISVGYRKQHQQSETQDLTFAEALRDVMVTFEAGNLVTAREPIEFVNSYSKPEELMLRLIKGYPAAIRDLLQDTGYSSREVEDYVYEWMIDGH